MVYALVVSLSLLQQSVQDLPEPVQKTVQQELGSAQVTKVQKEQDGSYTVGTKTQSLHVCATGELISKEELVPADKMPKDVQDTIKKEFGGKKAETKKVTKISYEVKVGNVKLKIAEDGSIARREESIKPSELPSAVAGAAKDKFKGQTLVKARKILEDGRVRYKVTAEDSNKKESDASFFEDGKEIR